MTTLTKTSPTIETPVPDLPGTTFLINSERRILIRQEPRQQLLSYGRYGDYNYLVWFPWTYYDVQFTRLSWEGSSAWRVLNVGMSARPSLGKRRISGALLPNLYGWTPCYGPTYERHGPNTTPETTMRILARELDWFLNGHHNGDGDIFDYHPVTRHLIGPRWNYRDPVPRPNVLTKWEALNRDEVLALPWPDDADMWEPWLPEHRPQHYYYRGQRRCLPGRPPPPPVAEPGPPPAEF